MFNQYGHRDADQRREVKPRVPAESVRPPHRGRPPRTGCPPRRADPGVGHYLELLKRKPGGRCPAPRRRRRPAPPAATAPAPARDRGAGRARHRPRSWVVQPGRGRGRSPESPSRHRLGRAGSGCGDREPACDQLDPATADRRKGTARRYPQAAECGSLRSTPVDRAAVLVLKQQRIWSGRAGPLTRPRVEGDTTTRTLHLDRTAEDISPRSPEDGSRASQSN